jgi:hypothetical protein
MGRAKLAEPLWFLVRFRRSLYPHLRERILKSLFPRVVAQAALATSLPNLRPKIWVSKIKSQLV